MEMKLQPKTRTTLVFAALCLLSGSAWMIDEFYPEIITGPAHTAAHDGLLAILFAVASLRGHRERFAPRLWLELALCSIALFALPTILATGSGGQVASLSIILISTSIPAIVVFLAAQASAAADDNPLRLLLPALAGLGGASLLLPFTWPVSFAGQAWLIAIILSAVLSAFAAIRLHRILPRTAILRVLAILCASAAIASALCYRIGYNPIPVWTNTQLLVEVFRCLFLEAPFFFLLIYLFREMHPIAISARYILIPLITIVESYLIERPHTTWNFYVAVILMAFSVFALIRTPRPEHEPDIAL
jgi:drug/metabolite transporter (DMT)-like permease